MTGASPRPLLTWALVLLLIGALLGAALDRVVFASSVPSSIDEPVTPRGTVGAAARAQYDGGTVAASQRSPATSGSGGHPRRLDPTPLPALSSVQLAATTSIASWYGPGFYGNTTACGQTYTPQLAGVAHKTLPCGTLVALAYGDRIVFVHVIDRGPYVAGRTFDLSNATHIALGCTDLCLVRWWLP